MLMQRVAARIVYCRPLGRIRNVTALTSNHDPGRKSPDRIPVEGWMNGTFPIEIGDEFSSLCKAQCVGVTRCCGGNSQRSQVLTFDEIEAMVGEPREVGRYG